MFVRSFVGQGPQRASFCLFPAHLVTTLQAFARPPAGSESAVHAKQGINPHGPMDGNTYLHLERSWGRAGYVVHGHFCCIRC